MIVEHFRIYVKNTENLEKWIKQIKEKTSPNIQKIIIGNKSDLVDDRQVAY